MNSIKTATFSLAGFDPETGELGIAVQSKFLAAGAIVPHIKFGVGAVATQALANPAYGPRGLELLERGLSPQETVEQLIQEDEASDQRQVGIIDADGRSATFTGKNCLEWAGGTAGENFAAQGNILVNRETVTALAETFQNEQGRLADRLLAALEAADRAGGDRRGKQSAALLVYKEKGGYGGLTDKFIDLRVDDHPEPIIRLAELLELFDLYFSERDVEMLELKGELLEEVQRLLQEMGYYQGDISGEYSSEFTESLLNFYRQENFEERVPDGQKIPGDILNYLRKRARDQTEQAKKG